MQCVDNDVALPSLVLSFSSLISLSTPFSQPTLKFCYVQSFDLGLAVREIGRFSKGHEKSRTIAVAPFPPPSRDQPARKLHHLRPEPDLGPFNSGFRICLYMLRLSLVYPM